VSRFLALCKARLLRSRMKTARKRALHPPPPLSTAFFRAPVQTVGKTEPNSGLCATLPAFHFAPARFSKTWTAVIRAACLVSACLSTFPRRTTTTTKKVWTNCVFHRSKSLLFPLLARRCITPPGIHRMKRSRDSQAPPQWCRVSQTDKGANTPCLARGLSRRDRSYREPQRWKSA
jgi:hypothetical protein